MKQVQLTATPVYKRPRDAQKKKKKRKRLRNRNCNKGAKCQLNIKMRAKTRFERDQLNYGKNSLKSKEQPRPLMNIIAQPKL